MNWYAYGQKILKYGKKIVNDIVYHSAYHIKRMTTKKHIIRKQTRQYFDTIRYDRRV